MARKKRISRGERYVALRFHMLESDAWKALTTIERCVLIEIMHRHMGTNNGKISYSVREGAAALRAGKATIARALNRLVELGFLVRTKIGAFSLKSRHATEWRVTAFDCDGPATKDFMRWRSSDRIAADAHGNQTPPGKL